MKTNIDNYLQIPVDCKSPQNFAIQKWNPDEMRFQFTLSSGWDELLGYFFKRQKANLTGAHNTQKIFGISDTFNNNSVRVGVRLLVKQGKPYWMPVCYAHIGGTIYQTTFDFEPQLALHTPYECKIEKIIQTPYPDQIGCYMISIGNADEKPFSYALTPRPVTIKNQLLLPSRTSGPYVECFDDKLKKVGSVVPVETIIKLID